ncbi:MAG: hypothetical protein GF329_18335 [Candidatus Lokiarchaeota archaeon]|nr:hypothetical protein [Candidatus Lokiarchaeota archaeon]
MKFLNQFLTLLYIKLIKTIPKVTLRDRMVHPSIDDHNQEFSFFAKPNMQLGLPNHKHATQLTPEGRIYTGSAEYVFFINNKLVNKRIWTLEKGYLPLVCYNLKKDKVFFEFKIFQYWLDDDLRSNQMNFLRIRIKNHSNKSKKCSIAIGFKFRGKDHRPYLDINGGMQKMRFKRWKYEFNSNIAVRSHKLMYITSKTPSKRWRTPKKLYNAPFKMYNKNKIVLISQFKYNLGANEEETIECIIPHSPIEIGNKKIINKMGKKDWNITKSEFEDFWEGSINKGMKILIPEKKVINTQRTNLIFNFMTQDYDDKYIIQRINRFQYNAFWIRDSSFYVKMYNMYGFSEIAKGIILEILRHQRKDGNYLSQAGQLDGFGQALWAFSEHIKYTNDRKLVEILYRSTVRAIDWFKKMIKNEKLGIMPPTTAFDNESIIGRYTGHNIWALIGLDSAIYLMKQKNDKQRLKEYKELYRKFARNFKQQLAVVLAKDYVIPPGLDVDGGIDWGNLLLIYPRKIFNPNSKVIKNSLTHYYYNNMIQGLATWMGYLHHYLTERIAQSFLILDDQKKVLECFYSMLAHTGSCNEGFEMGIYPWGDRDYEMNYILKFYNFPPHGWFGVCYNLLLRNMFLREEDNNLHLFSSISPEWIKEGDKITIKNASTYFGEINFETESIIDGIKVDFHSTFNSPPKNIIIHIPFFVTFKEARLYNEPLEGNKSFLKLEPMENFSLEIKWEQDKSIIFNYKQYIEKYKRKYNEKFLERYKK